jgi:NAD(P)-dependent dehydrogenase (short-subunit alcohol dehydrogenase family)
MVTGASRGIGAATARTLAAQGAKVGLVARDEALLKGLAAELGEERALAVAGDVTDDASMVAAARQIADRFGRIDAVVANAGINHPGTVFTLSTDDFARIVETNVTGTYRTIKAALPHVMTSGGYVLIVSSISSAVGLGGLGAYSSSKAATEMLAHTLQMELAPYGVGVGSVHPWFADTDLVRAGEEAMPSFADFRTMLAPLRHVPGPIGLAGTTLTAQQCADMITRMVGRRIRKRHVPRSAGFLAFGRSVPTSRLGETVQGWVLGGMMRRLTAETGKANDAVQSSAAQLSAVQSSAVQSSAPSSAPSSAVASAG